MVDDEDPDAWRSRVQGLPPPSDRDDDGGQPVEPTPRPSPPAPAASPTGPAAMPRPALSGTAGLFGSPALKRPSSGDGHTSALAEPASGDGHAGSAPASPADPLGPELARVKDAWPRFISAVREEIGVRVGAIVKAGVPLRVGRGAVEVGMEDAFGVKVATDNDKELRAVLAAVLGGEAPPVRWIEAPRDAVETAAPTDPFEALKQMRQEHPVVRALFEQFGAEIVWQ